MPGSMLDLPAALRSAGLRVWVAPDWKTNGHGYDLISPFGGVLHHTAGLGLRAVYGEPDIRPDVPQPRCNLWTPRPGWVSPDGQPADIAVICAGRAWQAGTGRMAAYDRMRAGGFSVDVPDAAALYGSSSDDIDGGWTSLHTLGNEVECSATATAPDDFPPAQLDVVATAMGVCVDLFGWPGVGCWAHHRQLTYRKPDMAYRGDIWGRAAALANPVEDDMFTDQDRAVLNGLAPEVERRTRAAIQQLLGGTMVRVADLKTAVANMASVTGDDEQHILAELDAVRDQVLAAVEAGPTQPASGPMASEPGGSEA